MTHVSARGWELELAERVGLREGVSLNQSSAVWFPCWLLPPFLRQSLCQRQAGRKSPEATPGGGAGLGASSLSIRAAGPGGGPVRRAGLTEPLLPSSSQRQLLPHLCPKLEASEEGV